MKMIAEIIGIPENLTFTGKEHVGHTADTPYADDYDPALKYQLNLQTDFGQGLLELIKHIRTQNSMRQYKLVFWDFDGVIKDSVLAKTNAFRLLFKEHPPELIEQICEHHRTHGGLSRFKKNTSIPRAARDSTCDKNIKIYCDRYAELVVDAVMSSAWVPGAKEYLSLNPHKQIFVLTSATPQLEIEQITKKLKIFDRFKSVYGSPTLKVRQ